MNTSKNIPPKIQIGSITRNDFQPSPIEPTWIIEGNPITRSIPLAKADDNNFSCGLWECTAGKFKYIFPEDEIVHILEGEVRIQENDVEHILKAGDTAYFPEALVTYWTVQTYVKKFAVFHSSPRPLLARIASKIKKLISRF